LSLQEFQDLVPSTEIIESHDRIGIYDAWNRGVLKAKTPLLTNWNADDRRSRTSFQQQIDFMERNPWVAGSYADTYVTLDAEADFEIAAFCGGSTDLPAYLSLHQSLKLGANPMHNAPVWRRELHQRYGLFDESLKSAGDYEFWLRCQVSGEVFIKSPTPHSTYFLNPAGLSTAPGTPGAAESLKIKKHYESSLAIRLANLNLPGISSTPYRHNNAIIKRLEGEP
jgi:hypothetical protein